MTVKSLEKCFALNPLSIGRKRGRDWEKGEKLINDPNKSQITSSCPTDGSQTAQGVYCAVDDEKKSKEPEQGGAES